MCSFRQKANDFLNFPDVVGHARFHRRSNAQGLMDAAEVVVHEVERDGMLQVRQLLRERIGQAREAV
jgi:hypothetical protein